MKKFIAFIKNDYGTMTYPIYELGVNSKYPNFYCDSATTCDGFDPETVKNCSNRFLLADTLEEIKLEIKKQIHKDKYQDGESGDVVCPDCGYKYNLNYYDCCYEMSGINESYQEKIECICGCKFRAKIEVKIDWIIERL